MSSVSTAFKVHYNQKLGDPSGHLSVGAHHGLWGEIDAPDESQLFVVGISNSRVLVTSWILCTALQSTHSL